MTVPTPGRPKPETPPPGGSGVTPPRCVSDPVVYDENGRLRIELPHPPDDHHFYPVSGAVLAGFVDQVNELRAERDRLRGALETIRGLNIRDGLTGIRLARKTLQEATRPPVTPTACCDLHNAHCEPPSDLCCRRCTEAAHPLHPAGVPCVLAPEMHPTRRDLDRLEGP